MSGETEFLSILPDDFMGGYHGETRAFHRVHDQLVQISNGIQASSLFTGIPGYLDDIPNRFFDSPVELMESRQNGASIRQVSQLFQLTGGQFLRCLAHKRIAHRVHHTKYLLSDREPSQSDTHLLGYIIGG